MSDIHYQILMWSLSRYALKYPGLLHNIEYEVDHDYPNQTIDESTLNTFMQARPHTIMPYLEILFTPMMETNLRSIENRQPCREAVGIAMASVTKKNIDLGIIDRILDFLYEPLQNASIFLNDECTNFRKSLPAMDTI